jgi:nitrate reductase gamma subunit
MNIASIYRLAQAKLSTESSRADHNLLLLVGHLNLLGAIHIHFDISEYEEMQRLDTELTALKAKADGRDAQSTPLCTASKKPIVLELGHLIYQR